MRQIFESSGVVGSDGCFLHEKFHGKMRGIIFEVIFRI